MVISTNSFPSQYEFDLLIEKTLITLKKKTKHSSNKIAALSGRNFEPYLKELMTDLAVGTVFENSIELIGGQKFPDIIAQNFYGIEVKTTTQNHWKTTGNSVFEGTRVDEVERIYMFFAKLANPIEFKCRPYEEVLSEIVVTHSPRYLIDMDLNPGQTIFDKINMSYDILRKENNPIKPIVEYYRKKLKPGEELWWMDSENNSKASNVVIRIWKNIPLEEKTHLINSTMAYFPELFGNRNDKFSRVAVWLVTEEAIVCPNVRDLFSASGTKDYIVERNVYPAVPRVLINLFDKVSDIKEIILNTTARELSNYWGIKTSEKNKFNDWVNLVSLQAQNIRNAKGIDVKKLLFTLTK